MGIHGLMQLINDHAPEAVREEKIENMFNRCIAIDASMTMYQFLIAMRGSTNSYLGYGDLSTESGEVTSHLQGILARTIRFIEHGVKPIYVFDGKPPEMKSHELSKRKERLSEAQAGMEQALEEGDHEQAQKFAKRTVRVTEDQKNDCVKLLNLLGVPAIESPSEAESQCATMAKLQLVWATGTEDMDSLTFGTPFLVRHLTFSDAKKKPLLVIDLNAVLEGMKLTMEQFVDLCILCGCDYCPSIRGIGPVRALQLIQRYGSMEQILMNIDKSKHIVPEDFPYEHVRQLFHKPDVKCDVEELKEQIRQRDIDEEGLVSFLVGEKEFQEDRVRKACEKIRQARKKGKGTQNRLENFFGPTTITRKKRDPPQKGAAKRRRR